ncbi:YcaO-like family protein [Streptomyces sp. NA04227]|uniref:YcaO-like family protein n=1 Tax=Streptomyces sp. NA04227 TaxID=2742136 RepID=UPI0015907B17|nr:YcaO-like family protein [Streptomyces sp. NA04227]QKW08021.1 YcaO-like family protein [Streptomyces sp. NA04227]
MIDFLATLRPEQGLAELCEVRPARPGDLLWQVLVRLRVGAGAAESVELADSAELARSAEPGEEAAADSAPESAHSLTPRVVGAYGHSRTDALVRGVGEAVERFALFPERGAPEGAVRGTLRELTPDALEFADPDVALGDPRAAEQELLWYPARRLRDGAEVLVPAALVDYPASVEDGAYFDPSPSGAASGQGQEMALRSALLETVERDALMVAWERRLVLSRIRVDRLLGADGTAGIAGSVGTGGGAADVGPKTPGAKAVGAAAVAAAADARGKAHASRRHLLTLWRRVEAAGLRPVLADLPTGLPGVHCTVAIVFDEQRRHPLAAVGCNTSDDPWRAMLGAFQEALQIRTVVRHLGTEEDGLGPAPEVIVTDDDRLRHVASRTGYEQVSEWVAAFTETEAPERSAELPPPLSASDIVDRIVADGGDPLALDLSFRLPAGLRAMGWSAMKVIPAGSQALRLSERHDFTWHRPRLASAEARTGCTAGPPSAYPTRPHPLP